MLRSDEIKISATLPSGNVTNCLKGIVLDVLPADYGMEITVDTGDIFYIDVSPEIFRQHPVAESSEVYITFTEEAGIALQ